MPERFSRTFFVNVFNPSAVRIYSPSLENSQRVTSTFNGKLFSPPVLFIMSDRTLSSTPQNLVSSRIHRTDDKSNRPILSHVLHLISKRCQETDDIVSSHSNETGTNILLPYIWSIWLKLFIHSCCSAFEAPAFNVVQEKFSISGNSSRAKEFVRFGCRMSTPATNGSSEESTSK